MIDEWDDDADSEQAEDYWGSLRRVPTAFRDLFDAFWKSATVVLVIFFLITMLAGYGLAFYRIAKGIL